ncbi:MAG: lipocalin family protein [Bacteroidales bacterium]|nr:lipocalin family protein [Bacteroidales bacterium]
MKKTTKVFAMLLFVLSLTTLTSCNKTNEQLIIGKWECVTATMTMDGETGTIPDMVGAFWIFGADGTLTGESAENSDPNTNASSNPATYVVNDNQVTITGLNHADESQTVIYTIKELTNRKLLLEASAEVPSSSHEISTSMEFKRV